MRALEIARLRRAHEEGLASGLAADGDEAFARIRERIAKETRKTT